MGLPERSTELFAEVEHNYWEYYRELEDDFLATRKYVSFHKANAATFSLEYLKLYQAVCSEIDVIGKAMAATSNQGFKPTSGQNNIYKWWYEIQNTYHCYENPASAIIGEGGVGLADSKQTLLGRYEIIPWRGFETEWYIASDDSNRCRAKNESTPKWWSDYNKVKHNRIAITLPDEKTTNYSKANLGNLIRAFAGLHVLETAFLDAVGTLNDLEKFANRSKLFFKPGRATSKDVDTLFK